MLDHIPTTVIIKPPKATPKLRIDNYYGKSSHVFLDGIAFGRGVQSVEYKHIAGEPPTLKLVFNVEETEFEAIEGNVPAPVGGQTGKGE